MLFTQKHFSGNDQKYHPKNLFEGSLVDVERDFTPEITSDDEKPRDDERVPPIYRTGFVVIDDGQKRDWRKQYGEACSLRLLLGQPDVQKHRNNNDSAANPDKTAEHSRNKANEQQHQKSGCCHFHRFSNRVAEFLWNKFFWRNFAISCREATGCEFSISCN